MHSTGTLTPLEGPFDFSIVLLSNQTAKKWKAKHKNSINVY